MNTSKKSVITNLIWRFLERCGSQGVSLLVSIILARLLSPSDYGILPLVTVFTAILQVFVDSGFANALIQKKDADDIDFSTVFYFNTVMCLVLYLVLFLAAPLIAKFYNMPQLTAIVRVLSLTLVISGLKNIQQAYVSRKMIFKKFFFATLGGTIGAGVVGIVMAYIGFGVWALVAQQLFNMAVNTLVLWLTVKWRPKLVFSFKRLKSLFSFGWKLLASNIINTIYTRIRSLIIGKMYTTADLAYYSKGEHFPSFINSNINSSIQSVLFPAMANAQDEKERVRAMTRRSIKTTTYILLPLMIGLAVVAEPFVRLVLTDKWLPAVPYLQLGCVIYAFTPIHTANLQAIKAIGRSDVFLKLEIIKKIFSTVIIIISAPFGVFALAFSGLINTFVSSIVNTFPNKKLLNYRYFDQLRDIFPALFCALAMGVVVWFVGLIKMNMILSLIVQVLTGAVVYLLLSVMFKLESFYYLLGIIKTIFNKKKSV